MRLSYILNWCIVGGAIGLLTLMGCSKPPEALTAAEVPAAVREAFSEAPPEIKQLAEQAVASFEAKNFPKALGDFQQLTSRPDLTKKQRDLASRCLLTVNQSLQDAQAAGDKEAEKVLRFRQLTK